MGEGKLELAAGDAGKQLGLLGASGSAANQPAAEHDGGEIRFQDQAAAERFHDDHGFDGAAAEAAMLFGKRQAELGVLRPGVVAPAAGFGLIFPALLEGVAVGDQAIDAVFEQALFFGEVEVLSFSSRRAWMAGLLFVPETWWTPVRRHG